MNAAQVSNTVFSHLNTKTIVTNVRRERIDIPYLNYFSSVPVVQILVSKRNNDKNHLTCPALNILSA